jgi:hypothetical protein
MSAKGKAATKGNNLSNPAATYKKIKETTALTRKRFIPGEISPKIHIARTITDKTIKVKSFKSIDIP